jgi:hypothetical protein
MSILHCGDLFVSDKVHERPCWKSRALLAVSCNVLTQQVDYVQGDLLGKNIVGTKALGELTGEADAESPNVYT